MKTMIAMLLAVFASTAVYAADDCAAMAAEKKLAGAAKTSFLKKCQADSGAPAGCEKTADDKKLAGAARNSFVKKCEADAKGNQASAACEATAKEKKLAGAAKSSFMKKCVADAQAPAN